MKWKGFHSMQEAPLCSKLTLSSKEFDNTKHTKTIISVKDVGIHNEISWNEGQVYYKKSI